jgi:serine/threonine-protein kinase
VAWLSQAGQAHVVKAYTPLAPAIDALAITGLRQIAPGVAASAPSRRQALCALPEAPQAEDGPESELPVPQGELLGGRYLIERIFAEGGMGIVCFGRHVQLDQPVAIKFLRRALAGKPAVVERFMNEGRALAALRSEHVVRVMDVGQLDSGRPYLVMEHLEGIDLDALVDRDGALSVETAVDYALQICEPLLEAHAIGIVHRDIKPENLFLWSGGPGRDIVKVLDFGLAKQFGSPRAMALTGPQESIGSPCYMSPEQLTTPQSIDPRTDIWSLGVVLHRLLTDTLPFDGNSILEVLSHVLGAEPKSLHSARPDLEFDAELEAIVGRCLEKEPARRYASMAELAAALGAYLELRANPALPQAPRSLTPLLDRPATERFDGGQEEELRIAGVHARWPGVLLVFLCLAAAAVYQADRSGRLRIRDLTDGRLTPARLGPDGPPARRSNGDRPELGIARGVYAREPTRAADGSLALRAEPEPELELAGGAEPSPEPVSPGPMSEAERARKQAAYRDYLTSQGLTRLGEVLDTPATPYD